MRIDPVLPGDSFRKRKLKEVNKLTAVLTQVAAIVIAFISVYFFFIKILFL